MGERTQRSGDFALSANLSRGRVKPLPGLSFFSLFPSTLFHLFSFFFSHHLRPQSFLNKRLLAILRELEYRIPLFHVFRIFHRAAAYSESKIEAFFFFLSVSPFSACIASVRVRYRWMNDYATLRCTAEIINLQILSNDTYP